MTIVYEYLIIRFNMKNLHYFRTLMFFFATLIVIALALSIPGFGNNSAMQVKLALAIPCILAGAWSLPPVLVRTMRGMIALYERITGRRVAD
jgi:hypothetical protein